MVVICRMLAIVCAVGVMLSHGLTENQSMWSNRTLKDVEVIASPDPFIQFSLVGVDNKYFRIYMSQTKLFNAYLSGLYSTKATGNPITVTSSRISSSGVIVSLLDDCTDCEIIFH